MCVKESTPTSTFRFVIIITKALYIANITAESRFKRIYTINVEEMVSEQVCFPGNILAQYTIRDKNFPKVFSGQGKPGMRDMQDAGFEHSLIVVVGFGDNRNLPQREAVTF